MEVFSQIGFVHQSVPQGSILGPLLFSVFIDDVVERLSYVSYHSYADDLQVYLGDDHEALDNCFGKMNHDLGRISEWSVANGLSLNAGKSKAIVFNRRRNYRFNTPCLMINGEYVQFENSVINLGVVFDSRLDWADHIRGLLHKVYATLYTLGEM